MSAPESVLSLRNLAVSAGGRQLLGDLDLEIVRGEMVALHGPSGCGKTTLLRTITGLRDAAGGEVRLCGECPETLKWPCYRRRTVLVDQRPVLTEGSVRDNLARPFRYRTAAGAFDTRLAIELMRRLRLPAGHLDQEARALSEGEQQRVCLARAMLVAPAVLLLDEPTSALDPDAVAAVEDLIRAEARDRGLAALIVTHSRRQANRWCDRVIDLSAHLTSNSGQGHRSPPAPGALTGPAPARSDEEAPS